MASGEDARPDRVQVGVKMSKEDYDAFARAAFAVYGPREGRVSTVLRLLMRAWTANPRKIKEVTT